MRNTVLVTGGTGYIAGWCIADLLAKGYDVRTTVRTATKERSVRAAVAKAGVAEDRLRFFIADLTKDEGWDAAMAGCDFVLHVASPIGESALSDVDAMIASARDGTLRVLGAAAKARVKRVVMTSAAAAARPPLGSDRVSDETVWTDTSDRQFDPYRLSKVLAERAAWDFIRDHGNGTTLTTILPSAVFGPVLSMESVGSASIIRGLLQGKPPAIPRFGFYVVDVRDLADAHIRAMTAPEAAGERFIVAGGFLWMRDIAAVLRARLGKRAKRVPTHGMPDLVVRLLAMFSSQLRMLALDLGRKNSLSSAKAQRVLGFTPRPVEVTLTECAESLLASQPVARAAVTPKAPGDAVVGHEHCS